MDNNKKGKYKIYGAIGTFFAIIIIGFVFAVFPIIRGIVFNSDEIERKKIDNIINQEGIGKIAEMKKVHDIFVEKQASFEIFLAKGEEVAFFKKIEGLAVETGNKMEFTVNNNKNVSAKKEGKDASIIGTLPYGDYILMEIVLYGNYENLIKFLSKLEKNEKYVNVVSLDIAKLEVEESVATPNAFVPTNNSNTLTEAVIKKKEVLRSIINLAVYMYTKK